MGADDLGVPPDSPIGRLADAEASGVVYIPVGRVTSLEPGPPIDRSNEVRSVTIESMLRSSWSRYTGEALTELARRRFIADALLIAGITPRPFDTSARARLHRALRRSLVEALDRFDRWRTRHNLGPWSDD